MPLVLLCPALGSIVGISTCLGPIYLQFGMFGVNHGAEQLWTLSWFVA